MANLLHTKETVKANLQDLSFLAHCIDLLNGQQLEIEREWELSVCKNQRGVSAADAQYFAYLSRNLKCLHLLNVEKAIAKTSKYAKQLAELLNNEPMLVTIPSRELVAA